MCEQAGLVMTVSQTRKTDFLMLKTNEYNIGSIFSRRYTTCEL